MSDREWVCPICGIKHDRDVLAANNIKRFAFCRQNTRKDNNLKGRAGMARTDGKKLPLYAFGEKPAQADSMKKETLGLTAE